MNAILKSHFSNLISLAKADGIIYESERKILFEIGNKSGLSDAEIIDWLDNPPEINFHSPEKITDRYKFLIDFFSIILSDKELHENEIKLLKKYSIKLGFTDELIENSIETMKRYLKSGFNTNTFTGEFNSFINY
jgi:uncharacterized tellurite resistance protein B-like protein